MDRKITNKEYIIFLFFLLSSFIPLVGYHILTKISGISSLISILLGFCFIIIYLFLIRKIFLFRKDLNILDKIKILFPKSNIIIYILILFILLIISTYAISNVTNFTSFYVLKDTKPIIITITFILTIYYILSKRIKYIFRLSEILFYIYLIIELIYIIGSIKYINIENIKSITDTSISNTLSASLIFLLGSITPLFLITIIPLNKVNIKKNSIFNSVKISCLIIFTNLFLVISSLGIHLTNIYINPDMNLYKKISLLNILDRIETTMALNNILNSLFFIVISIYFINEIVKKLVKRKKEKIVIPIILLIELILSTLLTINNIIYLFLSIIILILVIALNIKILFNKKTPN